MKKYLIVLRDAVITGVILFAAFYLNVLFNEKLNIQTMIPMLYVMAVFLISFCTEGFFWGIAASVLSVFVIDYAFTPPYDGWSLSYDVIFSGITFLVVAIITSTMITVLKKDKKIKAEAVTERMRGNLMRAISHDLRTPLTSIYGSSSAILDNFDSLSVEQRLKLVSEIQQESGGLIRIVENLLYITRINGDNVEIAKIPVAVEELIDSVVVWYNRHYPEIPLEVDIPEEFVSVSMDAILIRQVLNNMLENAVHHAHGMTVLRLSVTLDGDRVMFKVSDDGCGIPKDRLDKIFSGYLNSVIDSRHTNRHNMGIGLNVCAAIVDAHGGRIYAKNNEMGGASFYFILEREV